MNRIVSALVLGALACAPAAGAAQKPARKPAPSTAPAAAQPQKPRRADLSAEFSRLFPERMSLYFEIPHLATFIDGIGERESLLKSFNEFLGDTAGKGEGLASRDLDTLLDASVGAGVLHEPTASRAAFELAFTPKPNIVAFRMASDEGVAIMRDRVFARYASKMKAQPGVETVRGLSVTHLEEFSYAIDGRTVLCGAPDAVAAVLETTTTDAKRIGDEPGLASVAAKRAGGRDLMFAYVGAGAISRAAAGMFGVSEQSAVKPEALTERDRARMAEEDAMRRLFGLDAIRGVALGVTSDGTGTSMRIDLEVDRTRQGLASTLVDPPSISIRSAAYVPASAEQIQVVSVDAIRIYDLLEQTLGPLPPSRPGGETFFDYVRQIETATGMSLRGDLLPALGNELAYVSGLSGFVPPPPMETAPGKESDASAEVAVEQPIQVGIVEVRDRETVGRALRSAISTTLGKLMPGLSVEPEAYKGFEIFQGPGLAVALGDEFAIVGSEVDVRRCVDARESGETLSKSGHYTAETATWAGDAIYATYQSPKYNEALEKMSKYYESEARKSGAIDPDEPYTAPPPSGGGMIGLLTSFTSTPVYRDATGIHWENRAHVDGVRGAFGSAIRELLVEGPRDARRATAESSTVEMIRTIGSAEVLYHSRHGKYAPMEDLVRERLLDRATLERARAEWGYDVSLTHSGKGDTAIFRVTATPADYGRWGKVSYFLDESQVIRSADKNGAPAGSDDPVLGGSSDEHSHDGEDEGSIDDAHVVELTAVEPDVVAIPDPER